MRFIKFLRIKRKEKVASDANRQRMQRRRSDEEQHPNAQVVTDEDEPQTALMFSEEEQLRFMMRLEAEVHRIPIERSSSPPRHYARTVDVRIVNANCVRLVPVTYGARRCK